MNQIETLRNKLIEIHNILNLKHTEKEIIAQKTGYSLGMLHRILKGNRLTKDKPVNVKSLKMLIRLFLAEKNEKQKILDKI